MSGSTWEDVVTVERIEGVVGISGISTIESANVSSVFATDFSSNVGVYGGVVISEGLRANSVRVSSVASNVIVSGNVSLESDFVASNVVVLGINGNVYVRGNVGFSAESKARNVSVTSVSSDSFVFGNVSLAPGSRIGGLEVANVIGNVVVRGNVGATIASGSSNVRIAGFGSNVRVIGNVSVTSNIFAPSVTVSSLYDPLIASGDVRLSGNAVLTGVSIKGTPGIYAEGGNVDFAGGIVVSNVRKPVFVVGNLAMSNGGVISSFDSPVRVDGNAYYSGNVVLSSLTGNISANGVLALVGNVVVSNVLSPMSVYGNLAPLDGNVVVSNVYSPMEICHRYYANPPIDLGYYEDLNGRARTSERTVVNYIRRISGSTWVESIYNWNPYNSIDANSSMLTLGLQSGIGKTYTVSRRSVVCQQGTTTVARLSARFGLLEDPQVDKIAGMYNDSDGIYFKAGSNTYLFTCRSSATGTMTAIGAQRSAWNVDKLDGTGPSGITIDFSKVNTVVLEVDLTGSGTIRCGFDFGNKTVIAHVFDLTNSTAYPMFSSPSFPLRFELVTYASDSPSYFETHTASALVEGSGYEPRSTSIASYVANVTGNIAFMLVSVVSTAGAKSVAILKKLSAYSMPYGTYSTNPWVLRAKVLAIDKSLYSWTRVSSTSILEYAKLSASVIDPYEAEITAVCSPSSSVVYESPSSKTPSIQIGASYAGTPYCLQVCVETIDSSVVPACVEAEFAEIY